MGIELSLKPPPIRYKVISVTIPKPGGGYTDVGPILAASYDRRIFEVLHPVHAIICPLSWELIETFGSLETPEEALRRYFSRWSPPLMERTAGEVLQ